MQCWPSDVILFNLAVKLMETTFSKLRSDLNPNIENVDWGRWSLEDWADYHSVVLKTATSRISDSYGFSNDLDPNIENVDWGIWSLMEWSDHHSAVLKTATSHISDSYGFSNDLDPNIENVD